MPEKLGFHEDFISACPDGARLRGRFLLQALVIVPLLLASAAWADTSAGEAGPAQESPTTLPMPDSTTAPATQPGEDVSLPDVRTIEDGVEPEALRLLVKPLTADELEAAADVWLERLAAKQRQVSQVRLSLRSDEAGDRAALVRQAVRLEDERDALSDRLELIVGEWERKGGSVDEARSYVLTVTGADLDPTDIDAWRAQVQKWLFSSEGGMRILINLLQFLVIVVLSWFLGRLLGAITRKTLNRLRRSSVLLKDFLAGLVRKGIFIIGLVVAVSFLGVNIAPLLAAIGAAGLVVGLALQGTLSNFASGILILLYRPFDVGDVINAGGVSGKVQAMTLVSTTILTFDNQRNIVPNNSIWGDVITNVTGQKTRRVDMTFGIGYADDIDRAQAILTDIATSHPLVLKDPEPLVRLNALGESSVDFVCRPWVLTGDYWQVYWEITREVKRRFDEAGVSIPFPQRDVHVYYETPPKAA